MNAFEVILIGRPNVGKSSLFNALLGYRRTIVFDSPGTTLDAISERQNWGSGTFHLTDTLGMFDERDEPLLNDLLKRASVILFVVDSKTGPTPFDEWLAQLIRQSGKPALLCVNKCDGRSPGADLEFSSLGFQMSAAVSAAHRWNLSAIKEWCTRWQDKLAGDELENDTYIQVALVGKPNTGKSTLMNRLCQKKLSRVSPEPLTTRDTVGSRVKTENGFFHIFDTAGIRKRNRSGEWIEKFSVQAAKRAIRNSHVVLLLVDARHVPGEQDLRLLNLLIQEGKPTAVLFNFWDQLASEQKKLYFSEDFSAYGSVLDDFDLIPVSAKTGYGTEQILPVVKKLHEQAKSRIPTAKLNRLVHEIVAKNPPPVGGKGNFNILYASQVSTQPPTFVFFMNRKSGLPNHYKKYLSNELNHHLGYRGQPIRLYFRGSETGA